MNGKLYMHNLVKVAQADGTQNVSVALTENTVLKRWAEWITNDPVNLSGAGDYRIWQELYFIIIGDRINNGLQQQTIVAKIVENRTGETNLRGMSQPELISTLADFYGP